LVPKPFLVMATQNPIETEGTYPLPEAQVDRFMMKVIVGYPSTQEEFVIAQRVTGTLPEVSVVTNTQVLAQLQAQCKRVYVDTALLHYAVNIVDATRHPARHGLDALAPLIQFGASPRATIGMVEAARAMAMLRGRAYVLPEDVVDVVPDVLRHRLVLSYEALASGVDAGAVIQKILARIATPDKPLSTSAAPQA
jgi:MoxR-like ATPase